MDTKRLPSTRAIGLTATMDPGVRRDDDGKGGKPAATTGKRLPSGLPLARQAAVLREK